MHLESQIKNSIREIPDFPREGILFRDIAPLLYDQGLCTKIVEGFIEKLGEKPDAIAGIESRGFLFGMLVANKLEVPFILIRKAGKLPGATISEDYELEYGTSKIEMQHGAVKEGWKVLIHDDLLATGGTAAAAARLIGKCGARVSGFSFLISLDDLEGKKQLINHTKNITCLAQY